MPTIPISKKRLLVGATNPGINLNKCGTWDGSTSNATFTVPATFDPANLPAFTVGIWANLNSIGQNSLSCLYHFNAVAGGKGFNIFFNLSNNLVVQVPHTNNVANVSSGNVFTMGTWHRVVAQWSDSWTHPKIFIDGVQYESFYTAKSGSRIAYSGGSGAVGNIPTGARCVDGSLDQLDVWGRVLTYDEIVDDYYFANNVSISGKIFSLAMDEASGTYTDSVGGVVVTPSSVTQNVASYTTSSTVVGSRSAATRGPLIRNFGTCLYFPTNAYVSFGDIFKEFQTGSYTISAFIKPANLSGQKSIVTKQSFAAPFKGYGFYLNGKKLHYEFENTAGSNEFIAETNNNVIVSISKWYHVAMVYSNHTIAFYVDGVAVPNTISANTLNATPTYTHQFNIGTRNNHDGAGTQDFAGKIDEVLYFDTVALNAAQMLQLYNTGNSGVTPSLYCKFDEGSGSSALDSSGNNLTGTITTATYSTDVFLKPRTAV